MEYTKHSGMYCARWAYTGNLGETECQAKCLELDCRCFDVSAAPGPAPHGLAARTIFPAFARGGASSDPLDAFGYHGVFPGLKKTTLGTYKESHQGGAPLCMYNHSDPNLPSVIFSPLNYPKAHHMASSADFVGAGVKNTATAIPAGHSQVPYLVFVLLDYCSSYLTLRPPPRAPRRPSCSPPGTACRRASRRGGRRCSSSRARPRRTTGTRTRLTGPSASGPTTAGTTITPPARTRYPRVNHSATASDCSDQND